jgi:hypothetical protein
MLNNLAIEPEWLSTVRLVKQTSIFNIKLFEAEMCFSILLKSKKSRRQEHIQYMIMKKIVYDNKKETCKQDEG